MVVACVFRVLQAIQALQALARKGKVLEANQLDKIAKK
jgi:hypothetical protein